MSAAEAKAASRKISAFRGYDVGECRKERVEDGTIEWACQRGNNIGEDVASGELFTGEGEPEVEG